MTTRNPNPSHTPRPNGDQSSGDQSNGDQSSGDQMLEAAIAAARAAEAEPSTIDEAAAHVWKVLAAEAEGRGALPVDLAAGHGLLRCADFQALVPDFVAGTLSRPQALLLEDHSRECSHCRKAVWTARGILAPSDAARKAAAGAPAGVGARRALVPPAATTATPRLATQTTNAPRQGLRRRWWAVAAAVLAAVGLGGLGLVPGLVPVLGGEVAHAQVVEGSLMKVGDTSRQDGSMEAVAVGDAIRSGQALRTSRGGRAVIVLADGTRVEMGERAGVVVNKGWRDTTLGVGQGSVIIQAAQSKSGQLKVTTDDLSVAAKDTIIAVSSGTKGSRVSVIDGQVEVGRSGGAAGGPTLLRPGEQMASTPSVERVPVSDDVAWSHDAARYAEMLKQLHALETEIAQLPRPAQRSSTILLDRVPADTAIYLSLPNLSGTLRDARALAEQRIAESDVLAAWWQAGRGAEAKNEIYPLLDRLTALGSRLGPEIVIAVPFAAGEASEPAVVAMTEVKDEAALRAAIVAETETLQQDEPDLLLRDAQAAPDAEAPGPLPEAAYFSLRNGLLAVGLDRDSVTAATTSTPGGQRFAGSPLHTRLKAAYALGIDGIVAVDLARVLDEAELAEADKPAGADATGTDGMKDLGLANARFVVTTFRQHGDAFRHHTDIEFDGPRTGLAGWLASPGPMGALAYLSPDASMVGAFTMQDPAKLLEMMLGGMLGMNKAATAHAAVGGPSAEAVEDRARAATDDVHDAITAGLQDLAGTLGGEVAVALDGPLLPTPGWKLIAEVNDPDQFGEAFGRLVEAFNDGLAEEHGIGTRSAEAAEVAAASGAPEAGAVAKSADTLRQMRLAIADVDPIAGHRAFALRIASPDAQHDLAYYSFADGYLLMAPQRGLIDAALRTKAGGLTLERSARFTRLLPTDGHLNVSALVYQNFSALGDLPLAELAQSLARAADTPQARSGADQAGSGAATSSPAADQATSDQAAALSAALRTAPASLSYAYGAADRIVIAGSMDQNPLGIGLASLLGLGDPLQATRLLEELAR